MNGQPNIMTSKHVPTKITSPPIYSLKTKKTLETLRNGPPFIHGSPHELVSTVPANHSAIQVPEAPRAPSGVLWLKCGDSPVEVGSVYPILYRVSKTSQVVQEFSHQEYE